MSPPITKEQCGDTCTLVDTFTSAFTDYVPFEIRLKQAVDGKLTGRISTRAASKTYNVPRSSIYDAIKAREAETGHPQEIESQQGVSKSGVLTKESGKLTPKQVRSQIQALCREHGAPADVYDKSSTVLMTKARGWLQWKGIEIPEHLQGRTTPYQPTETFSSISDEQLPSTDQSDEYDESIGDQYRRVCKEVQQSDRPVDFKRAIELLAELTAICTNAWYGAFQGEEWNHHDWAHVNSDVKTIQSLVGQRAKETADEYFH